MRKLREAARERFKAGVVLEQPGGLWQMLSAGRGLTIIAVIPSQTPLVSRMANTAPGGWWPTVGRCILST